MESKWQNGLYQNLKQKDTVSLVDPAELDLPLLDKIYKEMESPPEKL